MALRDELLSALRQVARRPRNLIVSSVTLAVALGLTSALMIVVNNALLRPLPFADSEELVLFEERVTATGVVDRPSPGNFVEWQRRVTQFSSLAVWHPGTAILRGDFSPEVIRATKVSPNLFRTLGTSPLIGRTFGDDEAGAVYNVAEQWIAGTRSLLMSERLWRRRFGADPRLPGRSIDIDGRPWLVIGVMPDDVDRLSGKSDLWIPWNIPESYRSFASGPPKDWRFLNVVARLAPTVTEDAAAAELTSLAASLASEFPKENSGYTITMTSVDERIRGNWKKALGAFSALLGIVLLVACSSAANLIAAAAMAQEGDQAIKLALGADIWRLRREMLFLAVLIATSSAAVALPLAFGILRLIASVAPQTFGELLAPSVAADTLIATLALSLLSATAVVTVPMLRLRHLSNIAALTRRQVGTSGATRTRRLMLAGQVAVTVALVGAAVVLLGSVNRLLDSGPGFKVDNVVVMPIALDTSAYRTSAQSRTFYRQLTEGLAEVPGVISAGAVTALPLSDDGIDFERPYSPDDWKPASAERPAASVRMATPGYFEAIGASLLAGRSFDSTDRETTRRVVVVNETLAERAWGTINVVGRQLFMDYQGGQYSYEIVGVVGNMKFAGPRSAARAEVFIPHSQNPYLTMVAVVRLAASSADQLRAVREVVSRLDPTQPTGEVVEFASLLNRSIAIERFAMTLVLLLAMAAAALSAAGASSLASFSVIQRSNELALRRSLGASDRAVVRMLLTETVMSVGAGCVVGLAIAVGVVQAMSPLVFGIGVADALAVSFAVLLLSAVMVVMASVPARRAIRIPAAAVLR